MCEPAPIRAAPQDEHVQLPMVLMASRNYSFVFKLQRVKIPGSMKGNPIFQPGSKPRTARAARGGIVRKTILDDAPGYIIKPVRLLAACIMYIAGVTIAHAVGEFFRKIFSS
jgi:hypothetical protein